MITKRIANGLLVAILVVVGLCSCDSWLTSEETHTQLSYLTRDVDFVATSVTANHLTTSGADGTQPKEHFFLEFVGDNRSGVRDVLALDLLAPQGATTPAGEYVVGYEGEYVALSKYDVVDQTTGVFYTSGSFYAEAKNNFLTDYYGFLTEGTVTITQLEDGTYNVAVDAKSVLPTIKMTYTGKIELKAENEK